MLNTHTINLALGEDVWYLGKGKEKPNFSEINKKLIYLSPKFTRNRMNTPSGEKLSSYSMHLT